MKNLLKDTTFLISCVILSFTMLISCKNNDNDVLTVKDTLITDSTTNQISENKVSEEEFESIENTHTLTAIFDDEGNPVNSQTNSEVGNIVSKSKKSNSDSKINLPTEKNIGTVSAIDKNKKGLKAENHNSETQTDRDHRLQKANNAIPNL